MRHIPAMRLFLFILCVAIFWTPASAQRPWEPYLVKDLNPTLGSDALIGELVEVGSKAFFVAFTAEAGEELWVSDGTADGTLMVKDIVPGRASPNIKELTAANGVVLFSADDSVHGQELWRSDGTADGTFMLIDANSGPSSGYPTYLTESNDLLYCKADGDFGVELLISDGTSAGTYFIDVIDFCDRGVCAGSHPVPIGGADGILYFSGTSTATGPELWRTDGTKAGTWLVKDINPGKLGSDISAHSPDLEFAMLGGVLYFSATDGQTGHEPWRSDGTEAGTYRIKDIRPEVASPYARGSRPHGFTTLGNAVYFVADDDNTRGALWHTDGTEQGTVPMAFAQGVTLQLVDYLTNVNNRLWFVADDGIHGGEPWSSDGTVQGTFLARDLNETPARWDPSKTLSSFPRSFQPFQGKTLIQTINSLWLSDGTTAGTVQVPSYDSFNLRFGNAAATSNKVFFGADDGVHGHELWAADFTAGGTAMVKDINPSAGSNGRIEFLTGVGDFVYFLGHPTLYDADDASFVFFRSDGSEEGTVLIKGPKIMAADGTVAKGIPWDFLEFNDRLILHYDLQGEKLFISDGTESGTEILYEGTGIEDLRVVDGALYFIDRANEYVYPFGGPIIMNTWQTVMRSNGTGEGTVELARFLERSRDGNYNNPLQWTDCDASLPREGYWRGPDFTASDGIVFFNFCDVEHGFELWRTDGTPGGTARVADINPSGLNIYGQFRVFHGDPRDLTDVNGTVFFRAYTEDLGAELWKTDGTAEGTVLVEDIWPGTYFDNRCSCYRPRSSLPMRLTAMNGQVFFAADNGVSSGVFHDLWKSDGTAEGTLNVRSPLVQSLYGFIRPVVFDGNLYFRSSDQLATRCYASVPIFGMELWRTDGTDNGTTIVKDIFTEFEYEVPGVSAAYCWGSGAAPSMVADNQLLFSASLPESGHESWRTNGTEEGTLLIADINPGPHGNSGDWTVYAGDRVFGTFDNGTLGKELWAMNAFWHVEIDIKPDSTVNCVNINEHGVIPVAIMGSADVRVRDIDPESLSLQGLNLRMAGKSGRYLSSYEMIDGDGYEDLLAHFEDNDGWVTPGSEMAIVTGRLNDGTLVKGKDQICIVP